MTNSKEDVMDTVLDRKCNDKKYEREPMSKSVVKLPSDTMSKIKDVSADFVVVTKSNIKALFKILVTK